MVVVGEGGGEGLVWEGAWNVLEVEEGPVAGVQTEGDRVEGSS